VIIAAEAQGSGFSLAGCEEDKGDDTRAGGVGSPPDVKGVTLYTIIGRRVFRYR
jgi:hypothetical protein